MATVTSEAKVVFSADSEAYNQALDDLKRKNEDLRKSQEKYFKEGAVMFAAASAAAYKAIGTYRVQEQAELQLAAAIKNRNAQHTISIDVLKKNAAELQKNSIFGDEASLVVQKMGVQIAELGESQLKTFNQLSADIASSFGEEIPMAAQALAISLSKPSKAMTEIEGRGVHLTQAIKDQIVAMEESGDIMGAQNLIMEEMGKKFGGQAALTAQGTGRFIQLSNAIGDFNEKIGESLTEGLAPFANLFKKLTETITNSPIPFLISKVVQLTAVLGLFKLAVAAGAGALKLKNLWINTITVSGGKMNAMLKLAGKLSKGLAILGIALLVAELGNLYDSFGYVKKTAGDTWDWMKLKFDGVVLKMTVGWEKVKLAFLKAENVMKLGSLDKEVEEAVVALEKLENQLAGVEKQADKAFDKAARGVGKIYRGWGKSEEERNATSANPHGVDKIERKTEVVTTSAGGETAAQRAKKEADTARNIEDDKHKTAMNKKLLAGIEKHIVDHEDRMYKLRRAMADANKIANEAERKAEQEKVQSAMDLELKTHKDNMAKKAEIRAQEAEQKAAEKREADEEAQERAINTEHENELLRMKLEGVEAIEIEFYDRKQELKQAWAEALEIENETERNKALENVRLRNQIVLNEEEKHRKKEADSEVKGAKSKGKRLLDVAKGLGSDNQKLQQGLAIADRLMTVKELLAKTPAKAAEAYNETSSKFPFPVGPALGALHAGLLVAQAGTAASQARSAKGGGTVGGAFTPYDSQHYLLQPGEHIIPNDDSWQQVKDALIRDNAVKTGNTSTEPLEPQVVQVELNLNENAGEIMRASLMQEGQVNG